MNVPNDYIKAQYEVNKQHSNHQVESDNEEAIDRVKDFAKWVKQSQLPSGSFLDAGCRTGYAMDELAIQFPAAEVVGCDIVPQFIERAQLRGEAVVADLHDLPFDDQQFDWVFTNTVIEHCHDAKLAASELLRVARVGCLCITDLEDEARFRHNASHFTYHNNPVEWVDVFRNPDFWLMKLDVPRYSQINMLWIRKEFVAKHNEEYNIPC